MEVNEPFTDASFNEIIPSEDVMYLGEFDVVRLSISNVVHVQFTMTFGRAVWVGALTQHLILPYRYLSVLAHLVIHHR